MEVLRRNKWLVWMKLEINATSEFEVARLVIRWKKRGTVNKIGSGSM